MKATEVYERFAGGVAWCDIQAHLQRLRECAHGSVFEIGVRGGISTAALLMGVKDHGGHVISLDVHEHGELYDDELWTFVQGHSVNGAERILALLPAVLDVIFIDSDHTYDTTINELHLYGSLLRKGGMIFLHDTDLAGAGVRRALDEFAKEMKRTPVYHTGSFGLGELRR